MVNWTEEDLADYQRRTDMRRLVVVTSKYPDGVGPPKPSKHRNHKTTIDHIKFDSQVEAAYYLYLEHDKQHGTVQYYLRQVPIRLPGGVTYWCDFMVVRAVPRKPGVIGIEWIDVKGQRTQTFINKKKQVEELYPDIQIIEVKRQDIAGTYLATAKEIYQMGALINE